MLEKVLLFCRTNATEYSHKLFVEQFSTCSTANDSIPGVADIYSTCTTYSAEKIVEQLKLSHFVKYTITAGESDGAFVAVYKSHQHHVSLTSNCCSCSFSKVMGLPCRQVFAVRTSQNLPVFNLQLVVRRWHKDYQLLGTHLRHHIFTVNKTAVLQSNSLLLSPKAHHEHTFEKPKI